MCLPSLGTNEPTVRTSDWSRPMGFYPSLQRLTLPLSVLRMSVCVSLLSRAWLSNQRASLMSDRISYSVTNTTPMAPNFCAGAYT